MYCSDCQDTILMFNINGTVNFLEFTKLVNKDNSHLAHVLESVNDQKKLLEQLIQSSVSWICLFPPQYVTNEMFLRLVTSHLPMQNFKAWNSYRYYTIEPSIDKTAFFWIKVKHMVYMEEIMAFSEYLKDYNTQNINTKCMTFEQWRNEYVSKQYSEK